MDNIDFNCTTTEFAPAQRWGLDKILSQNISIKEATFLDEVFSKIPLMFFILNEKRQIVYLNSLLSDELAAKQIKQILGFRPGEVLKCENGFKNKGGCGTTKNCRHCGIVNSILESLQSHELVTKETKFISDINGKKQQIIYDVASKPFNWNNDTFSLVTLSNISAKKQKEQLEKTFFHDILNKATSISGISELLEMEHDIDNDKLITMLKRGIIDLSNEIKFQRSLIQAEQGELFLRYETIETKKFLSEIKDDFLPHKQTLGKTILIDNTVTPSHFQCDKVIINRIMTNLVKNAIEAVNSNESVTIGANQVGQHRFRFWVKNNTVMPEEIQQQIFKEKISTKDTGRGIGTHSIKLFTEEFLKGKVSFVSNEIEGTIFSVELPISN